MGYDSHDRLSNSGGAVVFYLHLASFVFTPHLRPRPKHLLARTQVQSRGQKSEGLPSIVVSSFYTIFTL